MQITFILFLQENIYYGYSLEAPLCKTKKKKISSETIRKMNLKLAEMFAEWSSIKSLILVKTCQFGSHGNQNVQFKKQILKINSSEAIKRVKLKL